MLCVPLLMLPASTQSKCDSQSDKENNEYDHKLMLSPETVLYQRMRNILSAQAHNLEEKFQKNAIVQ